MIADDGKNLLQRTVPAFSIIALPEIGRLSVRASSHLMQSMKAVSLVLQRKFSSLLLAVGVIRRRR